MELLNAQLTIVECVVVHLIIVLTMLLLLALLLLLLLLHLLRTRYDLNVREIRSSVVHRTGVCGQIQVRGCVERLLGRRGLHEVRDLDFIRVGHWRGRGCGCSGRLPTSLTIPTPILKHLIDHRYSLILASDCVL